MMSLRTACREIRAALTWHERPWWRSALSICLLNLYYGTCTSSNIFSIQIHWMGKGIFLVFFLRNIYVWRPWSWLEWHAVKEEDFESQLRCSQNHNHYFLVSMAYTTLLRPRSRYANRISSHYFMSKRAGAKTCPKARIPRWTDSTGPPPINSTSPTVERGCYHRKRI